MGLAAMTTVLALALAMAPYVALAGNNDEFCRLRPIAGYEKYFINSVENGDAVGRPFVVGRNEVLTRGVTVKRIAAWTGDRYLTGLEITMSDDSVHMFGHKNGGSSSYTFGRDEVLTYWYQWKSKNGAHKIAGIEFRTSTGAQFKKKASDTSYGCNIGCEDCLVRDIGSGILTGFQGYECGVNGGGDICRLTPIILRPIKYATLTNITYPELKTAPAPSTSVLYDYPIINNTTQTSTTKFTHAVTIKTVYTYTTSTANKIQQTVSSKTGINGEVIGIKIAQEVTATYQWETTKTVTDTITTDTTITNTQEFTFVCPAMSACRFVVSQGDGRLFVGYNDYSATNVVHLDSGAVFSYRVDGQIALNEVTPVSQYAVSGPLPNRTTTLAAPPTLALAAAAAAPADHVPNDPGDGEGIPEASAAYNRTVGAPALLAYRRCPRVSGRQLCTLEERLPDTVVRALAGRLMMAPASITSVQDRLPHRRGFLVVDYAAPIVMSRRGARVG